MKKISVILLIVLSFAFVLNSCSGSLVNFKYEDGRMYNKRLNLEYYPAPTNYEPASVGKEYGYYSKADMILYEITGLDPKEWLTQEYAGSATTIFYSTDITLPTLETLEPNKIYICSNEEITYSVATVEDIEIIDKLIDLYINGEYEEWPLLNSIATYEIKFYSEKNFPHLYYNLTYGEFEEGKFLYDRNTKRCVRIDDILIDYIG